MHLCISKDHMCDGRLLELDVQSHVLYLVSQIDLLSISQKIIGITSSKHLLLLLLLLL